MILKESKRKADDDHAELVSVECVDSADAAWDGVEENSPVVDSRMLRMRRG